ncbi:MAG: PAS domain S-box protein [Actinomycetota bacterium]|nr:PAS domain S-box protein [Actinomycetota bacterium]
MNTITLDDAVAFTRTALDNGLDAVAVFGDGLRVHHWNAAMEELSGIPAGRATRSTIAELFPAIRSSEDEARLAAALDGSYSASEPPFFGARDPARGHAHEWFVLPLVNDGRVGRAVLTARSVVVRGNIRDQMAETDQRFVAMANSSPVLLWMAGRDGLCNFFNETWLQFSGRSIEDEYGVGWTEGVHPEDFEHCMSTYLRAFSDRRSFEMEYRLRRHDGEYRWILDRGVPREAPSGGFAGFIGSCIDITDRIEAERETRAVADELARTNAYLERLLYATSHDLREPIRSVFNFAELLADHLDVHPNGSDGSVDHPEGGLDDTGRDYLRRITDGATRMRGLVDGMLEFASVRGEPAVRDEVDTRELIESIRDDLADVAAEGGVTITVGDVPAVLGDRSQLDRVFRNLVANAIKYRAESDPCVTITGERSGDEAIVCVADNGIGFDQKDADRIFEIFRRLHPRERYPGYGVGLALVRDVVERHGGRIWATSSPGSGARFWCALPAA